jgi:predicted O-methyltransferase YrrM
MQKQITLIKQRVGSHPVNYMDSDGNFVNNLIGLYDLCRRYVKKDMDVLELGSYWGVSASLFAHFAKSVTAVDFDFREPLRDVISKHNNITFHQKYFKDFLNSTDAKFDLVYIDGGHEYNDVITDVNDFLPRVKEGGFIAGHDYSCDFPGVKKAVNELFPDKTIHTFLDSSWLVKL